MEKIELKNTDYQQLVFPICAMPSHQLKTESPPTASRSHVCNTRMVGIRTTPTGSHIIIHHSSYKRGIPSELNKWVE